MTRSIVPAVLVVLATSFAAPASAQRETFSSREVSLSIAEDERTTDLALDRGENLTLRAPDAGEYALPVTGIVLGSLVTLGGAVTVVGAGFVWIVQRGFDRNTDSTELALGLGGAGVAVGLTMLIAGAAGVSSLRGRARDAERMPSVAVAPIEGGGMLYLGGEY